MRARGALRNRAADRPGVLIALAASPGALGVLVLLGWVLGIEALKRISPGLTAMNPMTALSLIAISASSCLHFFGRSTAGRWLSVTVALVGLAKLAEISLGTPGVDAMVFSSQISPLISGPGRMAPNTAAALALLGVAGVLVGFGKRLSLAAQVMCAAVALLALFALVGYFYGVEPLYTVSTLRPMAVHTGASLFISAIALASVPRGGLMDLVRASGPSRALVMFVLPLSVLIPIIVGAARLWGQEAGFYGTEVGVSIQVISNVMLTCCLLGVAIFVINRSDKVRLEREAALQRSQRFAHVGHVRWSAGRDDITWSEEAARIHGCPASKQLTHQDWPEMIHPDDRADFSHYVASAHPNAEGEEWRGRVVRPSGEIRHIRVHLTSVPDDEQLLSSCFATVSDVTDLEVAQRAAEAATLAKTAFLANMSHELRTPLNGVMGFSELLLESSLEPEQHEQASTIHDSARALLRLLNDILDFSKIEAGALQICPEPTRLRHLLGQCLSLIEPSARSKGVAVFLHIHDEVPDDLLLDGMRVRQIALNLLGNAVKFTERGFIALEASVAGAGKDRLVIRVHDTGVGIPHDRKEAIFADFVQADPGVAKTYGGTGLGLSISRRLAHLLGGSLELESQVGRGTQVELELPLMAVAPSAAAAAAAPSLPRPALNAPTGIAAKILLVEDFDVNQRLATAMLEKFGHEVEVAPDGLAAVRRFRESPAEFQLILMDVQMPLLDGHQATRQIRQLGEAGARIPIVGLSANVYETDVAACFESGMDDHLAKPFSRQSLGAVVARWASPPGGTAQGAKAPDAVKDLETMFRDHVRRAFEEVISLQHALGGEDPGRAEQLAATVMHSSHQLAGTAASFGRAELGALAAQVEDCLADVSAAFNSTDKLGRTRDITDRFAQALQAAA